MWKETIYLENCDFTLSEFRTYIANAKIPKSIKYFDISYCKVEVDEPVIIGPVNSVLEIVSKHWPTLVINISNCSFSIPSNLKEKKNPPQEKTDNWDGGLDLLRALW